MSLIGAAAIGAGATLLGNIIGAGSTASTNRANLKINQMNNEFNERMMQKQMDYNTMMWNKQNEYNTPLAQRARLEAAGMNPYMMLNGGSAGNAQAAGSTSAASAASAAPQQAFHPDFSGIPQSILMAKQGANIDSDTALKVTDNQTKALRNMQEIANTIADTENKQVQEKLSQTMLNYADQVQVSQLRQMDAQTNNIIREGLMMDKNLSIFDERTRLEFAQMAAQTLNLRAQGKLSEQQAKNEVQKTIETIARTNGLKISNDIAKRTAEYVVDKANNDRYSNLNPFNTLIGILNRD